MANALTNLEDRALLQFHNALDAEPSIVESVGFVREDKTAAVEIGTQHLKHAIGNFSGSAPSATDVNTYKVSHSSQARAGVISFTRKEIMDATQANGLNQLVDRSVAMLAAQARADENRAFVQGLNALFTTAHPLDADLAEASAKYLGATLTRTGIGPGGGDVVVKNLLATPFSESAYSTARQRLLEQTNWSGDPMGLREPFVLVVSPKNEKLARQVIGSPAIDQSASNPQGYVNVYGGTSVVVTSELTDDDDWFLIKRGLTDGGLGSPVGLWRRQAPLIQIREDDLYTTKIELYMDRAFIYSPDGLGIIGSNVS